MILLTQLHLKKMILCNTTGSPGTLARAENESAALLEQLGDGVFGEGSRTKEASVEKNVRRFPALMETVRQGLTVIGQDLITRDELRMSSLSSFSSADAGAEQERGHEPVVRCDKGP